MCASHSAGSRTGLPRGGRVWGILQPCRPPPLPRPDTPALPYPGNWGSGPGSKVLVVGAPAGLDIGPLPAQVVVDAEQAPARGRGAAPSRRRREAAAEERARRDDVTGYDVALFFTASRRELAARFQTLTARLTSAGSLWVCWPKRASGMPTDVTENAVRAPHCPAAGSTTRSARSMRRGRGCGSCCASRTGPSPPEADRHLWSRRPGVSRPDHLVIECGTSPRCVVPICPKRTSVLHRNRRSLLGTIASCGTGSRRAGAGRGSPQPGGRHGSGGRPDAREPAGAGPGRRRPGSTRPASGQPTQAPSAAVIGLPTSLGRLEGWPSGTRKALAWQDAPMSRHMAGPLDGPDGRARRDARVRRTSDYRGKVRSVGLRPERMAGPRNLPAVPGGPEQRRSRLARLLRRLPRPGARGRPARAGSPGRGSGGRAHPGDIAAHRAAVAHPHRPAPAAAASGAEPTAAPAHRAPPRHRQPRRRPRHWRRRPPPSHLPASTSRCGVRPPGSWPTWSRRWPCRPRPRCARSRPGSSKTTASWSIASSPAPAAAR